MTAVQTTTTIDTTTSNRQGVQLSVESQSNTVQIGNFVTDVTVNPYIAPVIVSFYASGVRPGQRLHAFFDSILVDSYCAPGVYNGGDSSSYQSVDKLGNWGDAITANASGHVAGQFAIPSGTFKTGDRVFEIADVTNLAQGNDAITTQASAIFTASNIAVTKQGSTLTTVNPILSTRTISNTVVTTNTSVVTSVLPDIVNISAEWEPIAQGLTINTPNGEAGVYATSIVLYFKQKSQIGTNGVKVYICETNNGYPDGNNVIPFSTVHLNYADISTSADATVGTTFTFESPVFLNNGLQYAFVVKPDNNDPDYFVYSANLGDIDITTGIQVFSQPIIGVAYFGATTTTWSALQTEYIKFKLNVASFTASSGDAYLNNIDLDYLTMSSVGYSNTSAAILPGDYIFQSTNSTVSTANTTVNGKVNYYDSAKNIMYVSNTTGNFTANTYMQVHRFANASVATSPNTTTLVAYSNTGAFYKPLVNAIVPNFSVLNPAGTRVAIDFKGTSNTYVSDTTGISITQGIETELFDKERVIVGRTTENTSMAGVKSANLHIKLTSDSVLLSPLIDMVKASATVIGNQIDPVAFNYNEYFTNGSAKSKYVSQVVTLASGQDAQDLQVTLTAHRPPGTDILVYTRFLNGQDPDAMSIKTWTPMLNLGGGNYSDPTNPRDSGEFVYTTFPYYGLTTTSGNTTSTNASANVTGYGTTFGTDIQVGNYVNMLSNSTFKETTRQVISITNTSLLTLNLPFNGNYTNTGMFVVPPPTTAWQSKSVYTQLANSSGAWVNSTGYAVATVTANTTSNIIVGSNTNFTILLPGQILNIGNYNQAIVSIANSTQLTVGAPWSEAFTGANGYIVSPNGLSYLNSNNTIYTTFKRFQLKVILQSNDTSKVPIINDMTALALQL